jgi:flagellar biosynthesis/type III secretory pathway protein FliH
MNIDGFFSTPNVHLSIVPLVNKMNYDTYKKFKESWATKLPWVEFCLGSNGNLHAVKCKIWSEVKGKDEIFATKWDSLCKHASQ